VHEITLTIEEKEMTVAKGFVQKVWTFNGTVPGPVIRVHQGDTIRVHLVNPATSQLEHSIDFHASQVAWNDEMTDQTRRGEGLRVARRLRRCLDVPLWHGAGTPPHRQWDVRHGHRRADGRLQAGRP
jgi:nitrite reductase (NO-forming)